MTKEKEQFSNRRWMRDILSRPILRATGLHLRTLASSRSDPTLINRKTVFAASGIDVDLDETQFWYDDRQIGSESIALLEPFVGPTDLVLGYELSEQTKAILNRMGVGWIDIWLHPIRFMDDVLFAFNSSDPSIRKRLYEFDMPSEQIALYADRIKVQTYKGWRRVEARVVPNSALFIGQMMNDKSVMCSGRMLNLLDFKDRFEEILEKHSKVYYSRHPYMKSGDEKILDYVKQHPKVELTTEASYRMLSNDRITTVFGLSSSVIEEARYFGKEVSFLYKQIVRFGNQEDIKAGATIMQDFVSPHFWAKILAPILETDPSAPHVSFIDQKDKVRDMLGFYWSYHDIDKTENMRQRLLGVMNPKPSMPTKEKVKPERNQVFRGPEGFVNDFSDISRLKFEIDRHDIISFDVFDTLIERVLFHPNDIFEFMIPEVERALGGHFPDFCDARRKARDLALHKANGEEVLLKDRYDALVKARDLLPEAASMLEAIEFETEKRACRPREAGLSAMRYALKRGKRVILVSDIFFERHMVQHLLDFCGVFGWHKLYLSSEEGVLKQTGRLFDCVLAKENIKADQILHIGDNAEADIKMARNRGINAFHFEDKARVSGKFGLTLKAYDKIANSQTRSLVKGLVARKLASHTTEEKKGATFGDPNVLGYALMGPAFAGFAQWILDRANEAEITDLYFLARDGEIAKRCYDILAEGKGAPKSHYLLASRRAVSVAGIFSENEVQTLLERNFTPCPIGRLLENRFGLDPKLLPTGAFSDYGFGSPAGLADWRTGEKKIRSFFSDPRILAPIIANAKTERKLLLKAYREAGLGSRGNKIGFVDIGHSGSLQAAISRLLDLNDTHGFYFATKEDVEKTVGIGHIAEGYVVDKYKDADRGAPYRKHIIMYELMFQNKQGSFLCYHKKRNNVIPKYLDLSGEAKRVAMIERVHDSACTFTKDFRQAAEALGTKLVITGPESICAMSAMLHEPWPEDANIFCGIGFENRYSARDMAWIVPPHGISGTGLWVEGIKVTKTHETKATNVSSSIVNVIGGMIPAGKKREKFMRDPKSFFAESRWHVLRPLSRLV